MAQDSFDAIVNAVMLAESGGRRFDKQGNLLTSSKGAQGEMQVMPGTAKSPGYGVAPAQDRSPEELARVGRDYLKSMLDKYGELDKALAAYNWGPGNTDKWIAAGADPKKLPSETRSYIDKIKSTLGGERVASRGGSKPAASPAPAPAPRAPARGGPLAFPVPRTADLGTSYQAALALSFLADEAEREDRGREYDEREPSTAQKWLASTKPSMTPEMLAMPYRSPFGEEQEPVRAADGGFIAVGYKDGGSVSDGEWKDGPPPPEVPRGLSGDIFGAATMEDAPRGPRTARERLMQMYHSARDFVEDVPRTPLGMATEGAMFLADRYKLMPPALQELMAQEKARRDSLRALRHARGYDEGGEVTPVASKQDVQEPPRRTEFRVPPGQAEARLREFNRLDPVTQRMIVDEDARVQFALTQAKPSVSVPYTFSTMPGARALYDETLTLERNKDTAGYMVPPLRERTPSGKTVATQDVMFLQPGRSAEKELRTRAHEAEHLLAKRGLGDSRLINNKFDELMGDPKARRKFVEAAVKMQPYLEKTYGTESAYFRPNMLEFQERAGKGPVLLFEQFAELAAIEQATGKDLTKDPELRKTIFKDKKVREVYNAMTGLRQTRLDARDLAPYTPIPEKEPSMMEFIRGRLGFAEGGEAKSEDKPEARASARGMMQSLKSGEGAQAFLRGLTMLPQNIAGAPVDLATLAMRPFGYNVEKPVGGSEWLKEKSRAAGVAFQEPTDANARALYTAGDIASNLINPAGATRAAVRGVKEVGEQAGQAAKMLRDLKPPSGPDLAPAGVPAEMAKAPDRKSLEELVSAPMLAEGSKRDFLRLEQAARQQVIAGEPVTAIPKARLMEFTEPVMDVGRGMKWYKLNDPRATILEGGAMNHSIGQYAEDRGYVVGGLPAFLSGRAEVYSLRGEDGIPRVTLSIEKFQNGDRFIRDVRGPSNSNPAGFRMAVLKFMDDPKNRVIGSEYLTYNQNQMGQKVTPVNIDWKQDLDDWRLGILDYRRGLKED
jgi:hypothetical protein